MQHTSHARRFRFIFAALLMAAGLLGCGDESGEGGRKDSKLEEVAPQYLVANGTRFPYFQYRISDLSFPNEFESELAVFVHPVFTGSPNKGLALSHMPTQNVRDLFGDELFGRQFTVAVRGGVVLLDELPVSLPQELKSGSSWQMSYRASGFDCSAVQQAGADFTIKCSSNGIALSHMYNLHRGFTSYQDYCSESLCTYKLVSGIGLLSPYHMRLLAERPNSSSKPTPLRGAA